MKRSSGARVRLALNTVLAAASVFLLASTSIAAAEPCKTCPGGKLNDGTDGALIPKEAPIVPETAPDFRSPLRSGTEGTLLQTGTEGTLLQTGTEGNLLQTGTEGALIKAGVERDAPPLTILILVDCSRSMNEGLGGALHMGHEQKMDAAKRVLQETMATIPQDVNVGLRVFGQSFRNDVFFDCQQSALLVPPGLRNRRTIVESVRQIRPYGLTPLTFGLREAANDLAQIRGKKQIILISDGAETCDQDPCELVRQLTAAGYDIKINIVGLGLKADWLAKRQLNCIAQSSGGQFYDSNTTAELVDNIRKFVGETKVSGKVLTKMKDPSLLTKPNQAPPADLRP
jgi:hypothetical protein